jgi:hypothetical protein
MAKKTLQVVKKPPPQKLGGRPPKLSQDIIRELCNYIRMGSYVETAALACGLTRETFYQYLKQGNKDIDAGSYLTLSAMLVRELHKAVAHSELRDLKRLDDAAADDWRAVAWRLERRHSRNWSQKSALKLETEKPGFSDSESLHQQMAQLISQHEKEVLDGQPDDTENRDPELETDIGDIG